MPVRIAHISDIHFGKKFDAELWQAVKAEIRGFGPDLMIVSGDFVDHPSPAHLLATKIELKRLCYDISAGRKTIDLLTVPGNHDVALWGNRILGRGRPWLHWIFDGDTTAAEERLKDALGLMQFKHLGCSEEVLKVLQIGHAWKVWRHWRTPMTLWRRFKIRRAVPRARVNRALLHHVDGGVLVALLDSNPRGWGPHAATGHIHESEIHRLQLELAGHAKPHLARIAVLHHHPLPIAFDAGPTARGAPFLLLRNAGTMLAKLVEHNFDLVLHGHDHKHQFARLELSTDGDSYPLAIVAAGSAALRTENEKGNALNLITISESGRITARMLLYGRLRHPNRQAGVEYAPEYSEPVSTLRRRAFARALKRHQLVCDRLIVNYKVTENGDLLIKQRHEGLRLLSGRRECVRRPYHPIHPVHGHAFPPQLDVAPLRNNDTIVPEAAAVGTGPQRYWIQLEPALQEGGASKSYSISQQAANCILMTTWEATERGQTRDEEWLGLRIRYPARHMTLSVELPPSMAGVQPYVRCARHSRYPSYELEPDGDVDFGSEDMIPDADLQREEQAELRFGVPTTSRLELERPLVGYAYSLCWHLPNVSAGLQISDWTSAYRELLLTKEAGRVGTQLEGRWGSVENAFDALLDDLTAKWGSKNPLEVRIVALLVYDVASKTLRPALSRRSDGGSLDPDFAVQLGEGLSGAAFLQRRVIAWGRDAVSESLIQPKHPPDLPLTHAFAVPIYHDLAADDRDDVGSDRPPPDAMIGNVMFGTDRPGSPISELLNATSPEARKAAEVLQGMVNQHRNALLKELLGA